MVLPPVQPYGQSGQPYEYPVQPYAQPVQPYGQSSQPYAQSVQPYEYPITGSPQPPAGTGQPARSNRLLWSIAAACLAVVLIIAGVIGVNTYQNHEANLNASATASAQNTQNTAEAQGTISIQGTQTAITSQATADAQATVNAQASATAQAVASNPYPSYMSGGGSLALLDSLQAAGNWQALSDTSFGGSCQFTAGAFHVLQTQTNRFYYCENNTSFENFAMEVQMQIIRGDCGGVVIRANGAKLYYFTVCANGGYEVWKYLDSTGSNASELTSGSNGAISGNDTVGILANGSSLTLYINQRQVAVVNDGTFASGTIALVAEDDTHPTEVAYSNLRIWV